MYLGPLVFCMLMPYWDNHNRQLVASNTNVIAHLLSLLLGTNSTKPIVHRISFCGYVFCEHFEKVCQNDVLLARMEEIVYLYDLLDYRKISQHLEDGVTIYHPIRFNLSIPQGAFHSGNPLLGTNAIVSVLPVEPGEKFWSPLRRKCWPTWFTSSKSPLCTISFKGVLERLTPLLRKCALKQERFTILIGTSQNATHRV